MREIIMNSKALTLALAALASPAWALDSAPVVKLGSGEPLDLSSETVLESVWLESLRPQNPTYQIGDEWGKKPVSAETLASQPRLLRAAQATASLGGATGFYLGQFNGHAILATNHHVCPSMGHCVGRTASFPLLQRYIEVKESLGTWTDIDLSLLVLDVSPADADVLGQVAANFDFSSPITPGQLLFTAGFGVADNPGQQLVANQDGDCKVFSPENDFRFMPDPDRINPGTYQTWSFANGCDVSHGDSGSAMVDRVTGRPVGVIWTGQIPKSSAVESSAHLSKIVGTNDTDVWSELSYAVPAAKIREHLVQLVQEGGLPEDVRMTLEAIVGSSSTVE